MLANLGRIHWWLGNHRSAWAYFEESLAGHRRNRGLEGQARVLARLAPVP